jgi:phosphoribosyl 1,2-cyclic phosphodiesterase
MALYISSLNSGSNGNCYYIGNNEEAILVDIGISCREVEKRMKRSGLKPEKVKAVFISHEHGDHIRGLEVFSRKFRTPVYITPSTLQNGRLQLEEELVRPFRAYEAIAIGNLVVKAFPKQHDAVDPHSFVIESKGIVTGVFTDIGACCGEVRENFKKCNAVFLESNYDDHMLESGGYPFYLKKRIRSDKGHLSNAQALELFLGHRQDSLSHLFLSHLSKDNNCPVLARELFTQHAGNTEIIVASRHNETDVYYIDGKNAGESKPSGRQAMPVQARLF